MSELFIGQIQAVGYNWARKNTALCDGQILPIAQNQALFSLLSTTFGGNGQTTFALPDLRSRVPVSQGTPNYGGSFYPLGLAYGAESITLNHGQLPAHTHDLNADTGAATLVRQGPSGGNVLAMSAAGVNGFSTAAPNVAMASEATGNTGGGMSHSNIQPLQVINFLIALSGLYPTRN